MKPSEWILNKIRKNLGRESVSEKEYIAGIMAYLDEEYEKNKTCEHEEVEEFRGMQACKKCHLTGYLK